MLPPLATARELAGASSASAAEEHLVCGKLRFFHYACDRHDDCGWGCGYRTVQSQLSWLAPDTAPPSMPELQQVLGVGAREWIGVPDAVTLLDALHGAAVEVLPLASGLALASEWRRLAAHFDAGGGPVMVGGGGDVYSKTVIGVRGGAAGEPELLILDPHFMDAAALHASDLGAVRAAGAVRPVAGRHRAAAQRAALAVQPSVRSRWAEQRCAGRMVQLVAGAFLASRRPPPTGAPVVKPETNFNRCVFHPSLAHPNRPCVHTLHGGHTALTFILFHVHHLKRSPSKIWRGTGGSCQCTTDGGTDQLHRRQRGCSLRGRLVRTKRSLVARAKL